MRIYYNEMGDVKMNNLEMLIDLKGMVQETIDNGEETLYVNGEYIDSNEFLEYVEEYRDKIESSEYINDSVLHMVIDKKNYYIEIA